MTPDSIPPTLIAATETDEPGPASSSSSSHGSSSPGRAIRAARERSRLSLEELAKLIKLSRNTLDALERDDFEALNEAVYVRGYYRKCAKVLALNEAELLAGYEKLALPKVPQAPTKLLMGNGPAMGRPTLRRRSNNGLRIFLIVIAVAAVTAVLWFLTHQPNLLSSLRGAPAATPPPAPTAATASTESRPASELAATPDASTGAVAASPTTNAPATGDLAAQSPPASAPVPTSAPLEPAAAAAAQAPAVATSQATPAATNPASAPATQQASAPPSIAAASAPGGLALQFKSTSWVRVEDADGRVLLSGVFQAGDRQPLRGRTPYSLFLGNAPGVAVEFDGKPVDVAAFVKPNATARFTVPQ